MEDQEERVSYMQVMVDGFEGGKAEVDSFGGGGETWLMELVVRHVGFWFYAWSLSPHHTSQSPVVLHCSLNWDVEVIHAFLELLSIHWNVCFRRKKIQLPTNLYKLFKSSDTISYTFVCTVRTSQEQNTTDNICTRRLLHINKYTCKIYRLSQYIPGTWLYICTGTSQQQIKLSTLLYKYFVHEQCNCLTFYNYFTIPNTTDVHSFL